MNKGINALNVMLIAGCATFTAPAIAGGALLATLSSAPASLTNNSSRALIVLGHDAQGRRVANVYQPNATQPSRIVYFDKPANNPSSGRAKSLSAPDLAHRGDYKGRVNHSAFNAHILAASSVHSVDPALIRAVIHAESSFNPHAVSSAGAAGLMQLMPGTAKRMGVSDRFDPVQNVYGGTRYLKMLLGMFDGDIAKAVAAYNAGEEAVTRHNGIPPYSETQSYVPKVLALYRQYQKEPQS